MIPGKFVLKNRHFSKGSVLLYNKSLFFKRSRKEKAGPKTRRRPPTFGEKDYSYTLLMSNTNGFEVSSSSSSLLWWFSGSSKNNTVLFDEGFVRSASMILASEIGDKTFFIAAVMAMKHSRLTVRELEFQFSL